MRVLITPRSLTRAGHPLLRPLEEAGFVLRFARPGVTPSEEELLDLVPGCAGWLAGVEPITARVLARADALRVVSRNGTGVDNVDAAAAAARGVEVCRAQGANARGVAELTLALTLACLRHLPEATRALRSGELTLRPGRELPGRPVLVVGCGAVGRTVVRLFLALDARPVGYDANPDPGFRPHPDFWRDDLASAWGEADVVTLHCPPLAGGQPLVDARTLERFRPGAVLVNTARGALVEEAAVLAALDEGRLGAYAADVFAQEPPDPGSALVRHPRVLATPHLGAATAESVERATAQAVENLLRRLAPASAPPPPPGSPSR